METFNPFIQCAVFELKILNFRFKITHQIRQSRSLYSVCTKLILVSYDLVLQKQKLLFKIFNRFMFINKFFNNFNGHDRARVKRLGCVILTNLATKKVVQFDKSDFHHSVITKIAILKSIEVRK
ncbi:hypothetical protein AAW31_15310 [Nitrosomonas communis]|uniref:Uncharacterized protein n=1 Tax=Nitrosomonas communis TaxID=44574 RepID=A0A0F7KIA7_9PROT|nr:hypothetical protein AAW31_15310 [Nitrosomonas communis]